MNNSWNQVILHLHHMTTYVPSMEAIKMSADVWVVWLLFYDLYGSPVLDIAGSHMHTKSLLGRPRVSGGARSCGSPQGPKPRPAELQASRSRGTLLSRKSSLAPSKPFRWKRARPGGGSIFRLACPGLFRSQSCADSTALWRGGAPEDRGSIWMLGLARPRGGEVAVLSGFMGQDCEGPSVVANLGI